MGVDKPNYTQIPNLIMDHIMRYMDGAELKVTLAIARHTFGYHRERAELTITQLEELTGLSRPAITGALDVGIRRNMIERIASDNRSYSYALVVNDDVLAIGKESLPIKEDIGKESLPTSVKKVYRGSKESLPTSVKKVACVTPVLKKVLKKDRKKEVKERESDGVSAPAASTPKDHAAVKAYRELHNRYPSAAQMKIIVERDPPIAEWVRAMRAWAAKGYKPTNVEGMLEWAFNPSKYENKPTGGDYRSNHGSYRKSGAASGGQADGGDTVELDPDIQRRMDEHRAKRKAEGSLYYQ